MNETIATLQIEKKKKKKYNLKRLLWFFEATFIIKDFYNSEKRNKNSQVRIIPRFLYIQKNKNDDIPFILINDFNWNDFNKKFYIYLFAVPRVEIVDEHGATAGEKFYKSGSTIELKCVLSSISHPSGYVTWRHGSRMLNYDTVRGGIR